MNRQLEYPTTLKDFLCSHKTPWSGQCVEHRDLSCSFFRKEENSGTTSGNRNEKNRWLGLTNLMQCKLPVNDLPIHDTVRGVTDLNSTATGGSALRL